MMTTMKKNKYLCYAACSFGLEAVVARELTALGFEEIKTRDARVYFSADELGIAKANLWLRTADRVYLVVNEFYADSFDMLYDKVSEISWQTYLSKNAAFPVNGDAIRSTLGSVSDIQSIGKKAIVDAMTKAYHAKFFKEDGAEYPVYISVLSDEVTVSLNTSGIGLNRRGYRVKNSTAPLRETLAAGMIHLSRWRDRPFYDPMCGSGTIVIEAALQAQNRAPGLLRKFAAQYWSDAFKAAFEAAREEASGLYQRKVDIEIFASDIDEKVLETADFHIKRAGVDGIVRLKKTNVYDFSSETEAGTLITNPPYAMRMGEEKECHALYKKLGERLLPLNDFRCYFICADEDFEKHYGRRADKKRKLYNGNIRCNYYQYFK